MRGLKFKIKVGLLVFGFVSIGFNIFADWDEMIWKRVDVKGIYKSIQQIYQYEKDYNLVLLLTQQQAFQMKEGNGGIKLLFDLRSSNEFNDVAINPKNPSQYFLATNQGLYKSANKGKNWRLIFRGHDKNSKNINSITFHNKSLFLGTEDGVFIFDFVNSKSKAFGEVSLNEGVDDLISYQGILYVLVKNKIYGIDTDKYVTREYLLPTFEGDSAEELSEFYDDEVDDNLSSIIRFVHLGFSNRIGAITPKGYFIFDAKEDAWKKSVISGLPHHEINVIIEVSQSGHGFCDKNEPLCTLQIAGTRRGAFFLKNQRWIPMYGGMTTNVINDMVALDEKTVLAATDRGFFSLDLEKAFPTYILKKEAVTRRSMNEPNVKQVHQWAIDYAEVNPKKIQQWRELSKRKALFPNLSIGFDGGTDISQSDSVWGSYTGGGSHYIGPDDKSWGRDFGWDISLSWDLSDWVWSTDQTTIDSRSKLMVELREDILDQVTRLYFERKRIQLEVGNGIEDSSALDKQLRLDELTALLDGYTGGRFSREIEGEEVLDSKK